MNTLKLIRRNSNAFNHWIKNNLYIPFILVCLIIFLIENQFEIHSKSDSEINSEWQSKLEKDETYIMRKGSLAAHNFNPNGVCGENGYKCVISYGLYGSDARYVDGMLENAKILNDQKLKPETDRIYTGWNIRVYHDDSVPVEYLEKLRNAGAELLKVENIGGDTEIRFWRFLVAEDPNVDRYVIRDSDSHLNIREWTVVKEWMKSGYSIHTIRDHIGHDWAMNGGLWGGVKGALKNLKKMIDELGTKGRSGYNADQIFLTEKIWPMVEFDQIGHDSYTCYKYRNSHPFPTKRPENFQHVGQVFINGEPRQGDDIEALRMWQTPAQCRGKPEWTRG